MHRHGQLRHRHLGRYRVVDVAQLLTENKILKEIAGVLGSIRNIVLGGIRLGGCSGGFGLSGKGLGCLNFVDCGDSRIVIGWGQRRTRA